MAHGQTTPAAIQASPDRLVPRQGVPRVTRRPRTGGDSARGDSARGGATRPTDEPSPADEPRPVVLPGESVLWPGTTGPVDGTPPRRPGSVRRTISVMMERPDGLTGPLHLIGVGRDLLTPRSGEANVLGTARLRVVLDYMDPAGTVLAIESEPAVAALAELVGTSTRAGFRSAARRALAAESRPGTVSSRPGPAEPAPPRPEPLPAGTHLSLLGQLLDDVPVAVLVSGAALGRNGIFRPSRSANSGAESGGNPMIDVCAGWQQEGSLARLSAERHADPGMPVQPISVRAGDLDIGADPLGWHPLPELSSYAMRRLRRIDLSPFDAGSTETSPTETSPAEGGVRVDALLRDTFLEAPGREIVIHEYGVDADADPAGRFTRSAARAGVLPGAECPQALGSAGRIVGMNAADLRRTVGRAFVGTSTCTHLNDTLRALGDLRDLIAYLPGLPTD